MASTSKVYEGRRTIDGLVVTVDGNRLDEHYDVKRFTKFGFEWSYEGASPQRLALAILVEHLGDNQRAIRLAEPFMKKVVANLDNDWRLTGGEIDEALAALQ
jgi:Family of unknown function (DUF6166)